MVKTALPKVFFFVMFLMLNLTGHFNRFKKLCYFYAGYVVA